MTTQKIILKSVRRITKSIDSSRTEEQLESCANLIENFCMLHRNNNRVVEVRAYLHGYLEQKIKIL
jgi:hypothetical protein